jgi:hypothetical protein
MPRLWSHGFMLSLPARRRVASHHLWCLKMTFLRSSSNVFTYCSTVSCDFECEGVVLILQIPRCCNILCKNHDSKFQSQLLCSYLGTLTWQKNLVSRMSITTEASWLGMVENSGHLREEVHGNQEVLIPLLPLWEGSCDVYGDPHKWCPILLLLHQAPA